MSVATIFQISKPNSLCEFYFASPQVHVVPIGYKIKEQAFALKSGFMTLKMCGVHVLDHIALCLDNFHYRI